MPKTVLLITNRRAADPGGRAGKVATRKRLLSERGWNVVVGHAPEPYIVGAPSALRRCVRVGRQEDVDVVLSFNNPFHLHVLGYFTSSILRTPWIAELRDPIASHPDREPRSPVTWGAKITEHLVVHQADRVIWFDGIQIPDDYFERYCTSTDHITKLPPMGYEKSAFESANAKQYDQFTITYAGMFYQGWIEPYSFLSGLSKYADATGDDDLRSQFYGDWSKEYTQIADNLGVSDKINTHDFVSHEEIVPILKGSDVLLYIGGEDPDNRLNLPSKLWDYVGAQRPILAVVDPSFRVADFIREHKIGIVADHSDPNAIAGAIRSLKTRYSYDPDPEVIHGYTRERSVDRITGILNETSAIGD